MSTAFFSVGLNRQRVSKKLVFYWGTLTNRLVRSSAGAAAVDAVLFRISRFRRVLTVLHPQCALSQ